MHLRTKSNASILIALTSMLALVGCGTDDTSDPTTEMPKAVVHNIVSYPCSGVLPRGLVWEPNHEDPIFASPTATPGA